MTKRRTSIMIIAGLTAAAGLAVAGTVAASQFGDDDETPITGDALVRATDAALAHTGEGRVTDTEVGDEDSYYEVEVTLDSGAQVDVQLDADFRVVDVMADDETDDGDG